MSLHLADAFLCGAETSAFIPASWSSFFACPFLKKKWGCITHLVIQAGVHLAKEDFR